MKTESATLLVISHTSHFLDANGKPCGWIPTVRELDFLARHFKEVIHLAVLQKSEAPSSTTGYEQGNIQFEAIPAFGGAGVLNKLKIPWVMLLLLFKLPVLLRRADVFQFRSPTSIGLFIIPFLSFFFKKKPGWYKYAGNWTQPNMPKSYALQKQRLEQKQKRIVTINGQWPNQPDHVRTFENPCLSMAELPAFKEQAAQKSWDGSLVGCFVGRLEDAKGVQRIVDLLCQENSKQVIGTFHFVGDGSKLEQYKSQLEKSKVNVQFHGFLSRQQTFNVYASSHLFLLPSDSEGFPKVIAEAAAFGCVPVASDVSSIGQYVNSENGFLWDIEEPFVPYFNSLQLEPKSLEKKSTRILKMAELFTFEAYWRKLDKHVFSQY